MIARATGQPIGQIELILGLRRQIDGTKSIPPMHHMVETTTRRPSSQQERSPHAMTGTQVALLVVYAVIIAVWPIRAVVLAIILRRQQALTPCSPQFRSARALLWSRRSCLPRTRKPTWRNACSRSAGRPIPISKSWSWTTGAPTGPARSPAKSRRRPARPRPDDRQSACRMDRQDSRARACLAVRERPVAACFWTRTRCTRRRAWAS